MIIYLFHLQFDEFDPNKFYLNPTHLLLLMKNCTVFSCDAIASDFSILVFVDVISSFEVRVSFSFAAATD